MPKKPFYQAFLVSHMKHLAFLVAIGIFLFVAGVVSFFAFGGEDTLLLARTDVVKEVQMEGTIVSTDAIDIGFPFSGKVVSVHALLGDEVLPDEVLARLDTADGEGELKQLEAQMALERVRLSQLLSGVSGKEIAVLEAKVEEARVALENAVRERDDLDRSQTAERLRRYALVADYAHTVELNADNALKALEGIYDDDYTFRDIFVVPESPARSEAEWQMRFARTALGNVQKDAAALGADASPERIEAALSQFKTNCEVIRSLLQKTADLLDVSHTVFGAPDVGGFRTTVAVQRAVINATQTALLTLEQDIVSYKIESEREANEADGVVKQLTASLETIEKELALKKAVPGESEGALLQARVKEYESRIALVRDRVRRAELRAPVKGIVTEVSARQGETVKAGERAFVLAPASQSRIEGELAEGSPFVQLGDEAVVSFADGRSFKGTVGMREGTKVVVYLHEGVEGVELPQRAMVTVRAMVRDDALMVPKGFFFEKDGIQNVFVLKEGKKVPTAVLAGMTWGGAIEILEGVSEGEYIVKP